MNQAKNDAFPGSGSIVVVVPLDGTNAVFNDPESSNYFSDIGIRHGFVKKVYGIVLVQLLVTTLMCFTFLSSNDLVSYVQKNSWVFKTVLIFTIVLMLVVSIVLQRDRSTHNQQMSLLGLFTVTESILVSIVASYYPTSSLLVAVGITTGVVVVLSLFASQVTYDFTGWGPYILVASLMFLLFSFALMVIGPNDVTKYVYMGIGVSLYSMFLVYDTQLIIGGKHRKYALQPDDYVLGALLLFTDIIGLFLLLLGIGNE